MTVYEQRVLPHRVNWSMRQPTFNEYRSRVLEAADGCVLEIGIGSGLNLPHYGRAVTYVIGIEPSPTLLAMALDAGATAQSRVELLQASAEAIPLESESVDTGEHSLNDTEGRQEHDKALRGWNASVTMDVCDVSAGHTNMCVCAGWSGYIGADFRARHAYPLLNPQNAVLDSHNPA